MGTESLFKRIGLSLGFWIFVFVGVVLTIVSLVNGHIGGFQDFVTTLAFDLIYAVIYVILRLIPNIDNRVFFLKGIK
jgi:hypothetical protein